MWKFDFPWSYERGHPHNRPGADGSYNWHHPCPIHHFEIPDSRPGCHPLISALHIRSATHLFFLLIYFLSFLPHCGISGPAPVSLRGVVRTSTTASFFSVQVFCLFTGLKFYFLYRQNDILYNPLFITTL